MKTKFYLFMITSGFMFVNEVEGFIRTLGKPVFHDILSDETVNNIDENRK